MDERYDTAPILQKMQEVNAGINRLALEHDLIARRLREAEAFLRALDDGRIVSTNELDEAEIVNARAAGRLYVLPDGLGYVRFPNRDDFQGYAADCRASEVNYRERLREAEARVERLEGLTTRAMARVERLEEERDRLRETVRRYFRLHHVAVCFLNLLDGLGSRDRVEQQAREAMSAVTCEHNTPPNGGCVNCRMAGVDDYTRCYLLGAALDTPKDGHDGRE